MKTQKRLAAQLLGCSRKRISFDEDSLDEIKEAITKADLKNLIKEGVIKRSPIKGISKVRARKRKIQKRRGQRRGMGSRKGVLTSRLPRKKVWMDKIRLQRAFLKNLRERNLVGRATYRMLYLKAKGGFFRSIRHLKLYISDNKLVVKK